MHQEILSDNFGRTHNYLRISVTDACNLRCLYCMPDEHYKVTPAANMMQADEIEALAKTFISLGIDKIRLTGGEPLIRKDIREIIERLAKLPVELTMTTNGYLADEFIGTFINAEIRTINIGLDTLDADTFQEMTRRNHFEKIISNVHLLSESGIQVKLNVVIMKGINEDSIFDFISLTRKHLYDVRFIEFMPFTGNSWQWNKVIPSSELKRRIEEQFEIEKIDGAEHETSRNYRVPDHIGTFGFISTMTEPFCSGCNRIRLTADGKLKNCLLSNYETDLLSAIRRGENIIPLIKSSIASKKKERAGIFDFEHTENRSMIAIGG